MRAANRLLSGVLGLVLAAAFFVLAIEIVAALMATGPVLVPYDSWREMAAAYRWSSPEVLWINGAVLVAGLLLLVLQFVRQRPQALPSGFDVSGIEVVVDRSGLEEALSRAAARVAGVAGASARAGKRRVRVKVDVSGDGGRKVAGEVEDVVRSRLQALRLEPAPKVTVRTRRKGRVE